MLITTATSLPPASPAYAAYWRFAAERQRIYMKRVRGESPPWTEDPILGEHRFTNAYRASDRVSQYLIRLQQGDRTLRHEDIIVRTLFFKIFNKVETWEDVSLRIAQDPDRPPLRGLLLADDFRDELRWSTVGRILSDLKAVSSIYSAAYIMPSGGAGTKHLMHLKMLEVMLRNGLVEVLASAKSLEAIYRELKKYKSVGPFLAFQWAIDLNYSVAVNHDEGEFVVAGPGALDGIRKCFPDPQGMTASQIIHRMTEAQDEEFERHGLEFAGLWGRTLQPIDIQNCFCETSKYTRKSHPEIEGTQGRTQIKQRFVQHGPIPIPFFPPKWGLNRAVQQDLLLPDGTRRIPG